jgi:anti-sigma-K factor RskA
MVERRAHSEPDPDVAGYVFGALSDDDAAAFARHLPECEACRTELDQLAGLPGLLADVPEPWALPAGLEERTFAAVEASALGSGAAPSPAQPGAVPPRSAVVPDNVVPITAARRGRGRFLLAAAVAVVVLAAGIAALTSLRSHPSAPLATIRLISADGGAAHGAAVVRATPAGLTIDMTVDGLPPAPDGKVYTCWLVAADDTLAKPDRVSVGSFVAGGQTVHTHWTTAADLGRFPHLGITLEPDNGNPSHQGPKVLTGA